MNRPMVAAPHLILFLGMVAAGCAGGPETVPDDTDAPAPAPEIGLDAPPGFEVGDTFRFDNPETSWTVVALENGRAIWESDSGDTQTTDMNPLLPALEWSSDAQGSGKRLISGVEGNLFPLEVGAKTTFRSTVSMDRPPYAWEANWTCEVTGIKQVEVPAGNFNTFDVVCTRAGVDENRFSYAPDLGHWVISSTRESADGPLRSRRLVGFTKARASTLVIGTDTAGETVISAEPVPEQQPETVAAGTSQTKPAAEMPKPAAEMPKPKPKAAPKERPPMSIAALPGGESGYGLHIASYKDQSNVDAGWRLLKQRYLDVLQDYEPVVRRADLGEKGIFYRLLAGPISDLETARARCKALRELGKYCKVIAL